MATTPTSPVKDPPVSASQSVSEPEPSAVTANPQTPLLPPKPENPNPTPSPVKTEPAPPSDAPPTATATPTPTPSPTPTPTPVATTTTTTATTTSRPPESPAPTEPPAVDIVHIPSYSRWFSWNHVHDCEARFLPEFFDGRSPSKNPRVYLYYRNEIVKLYRQNPSRKITFTDARKTIIGDVGSIRRVFDFLETWGLVNYSGSTTKPLKWEDKETSKSSAAGGGGGGRNAAESSGSTKERAKRVCNGCKSVCSIACFACDKYDLTLCARCYVRGNYRVGVSSSDFRRVEINDDTKADWTEKETLHLLEALMHFGDDWKKVAHHVGGRSERECVSQFIKLHFADEYDDDHESMEVDSKSNPLKGQSDVESGAENSTTLPPNKRIHLSPLVDASNPIMSQAAFLSALAGVEVAEAASEAAVRALSEVEYGISNGNLVSASKNMTPRETESSTDERSNLNPEEAALLDANSVLEKEEADLEKAISEIAEVQMKEIHEKIVHFEELDLLMEKEKHQLEQMKNQLYIDQLSLILHKHPNSKPREGKEENVRNE